MLNSLGVSAAVFLLIASAILLWRQALVALDQRRSLASVVRVMVLGAATLGVAWVTWWLALPCGVGGCGLTDAVRELRHRTVVVDRHGEPFGVLEPTVGPWVSLDAIPAYVPFSALAAEDRRFWGHSGMDLKGTGRAVIRNLQGRREGASTIAFQVAQLALGRAGRARLPRDGTLAGKLAELSTGWRLVNEFGKPAVLEMYLNAVPLGPVTGYPAAARYYFAKDAGDLGPGEAATLAAMIRRPSGHDPFRHPEVARLERDRVLGIMAELSGDPGGSMARAKRASLRPVRAPRSPGADYLAYLRRDAGQYETRRDTLRTSVDLVLEREGRRQLQRVVRDVERGRYGAPGRGKSPLQAIFLTLDQRGEVRAYMAARPDAATIGFDRIATGQIRLASTVKPFLLAALLERRLVRLPDTVGELEARVGGALRSGWPGRLRRTSCLDCTLEEAIARSDNYAAYLMWELLPAEAHRGVLAHQRGVPASDPTAALGTGVATPMDLARAYTGLLTGAGTGIGHGDGAPRGVRTDIMAAMGRALHEGTGRQAGAVLGTRTVAGVKTGTVDGNREMLLVGYYLAGPDTLVSVLWLGHDEPRRISARGSAGTILAEAFARAQAVHVIPQHERSPTRLASHE